MDDELAALLRDQRLGDAAALLERRGDPRGASDLYERACRPREAAAAALRAGDDERAFLLLVEAEDGDGAQALLPRLAQKGEGALRLTPRLLARGELSWAARLQEAAGHRKRAADTYQRAGLAGDAARLFEAEGEPVQAARALEAALQRDPEAWEEAVALGGLLLRHGRPEGALRVLQRVPSDVPQRPRALVGLAQAAAALHLREAEQVAREELERLGGRPSPNTAANGAAFTERGDPPLPPGAPGEAPPAPLRPSAPPRSLLYGRYEVLQEVASSSTARVLKASDALSGRLVALKLLTAHGAPGEGRDALARFEREARVLARLGHPAVVTLVDFIAEGPALALEWMAGGTLEQRLAKGRPTPARAVEIAQTLLHALSAAHRAGVLHRDVKPSNVLFDEAGGVRLGDFGAAHLGDASTTATAAVIGSRAYMSPEQREGRPADVRSDVYGVGAVLLEMLTGSPPAGEDPPSPASLLPSAFHPELDGRHDAAVLALVAPSPEDRPEDGAAAAQRLAALRWPDSSFPAADPSAVGVGGNVSSHHRLGTPPRRYVQGPGGALVDGWMGRAVQAVPLSEAVVVRAGAFARAAHPALQAVLRVDRDEGVLWLEAPRGAPLMGPLPPAALALLEEALAALHREGLVHGHVDRQHLALDEDGAPTLLFAPEPVQDARASDDAAHLHTLSHAP